VPSLERGTGSHRGLPGQISDRATDQLSVLFATGEGEEYLRARDLLPAWDAMIGEFNERTGLAVAK
jgi:hypothetical protein